jgi:hypothetical protein
VRGPFAQPLRVLHDAPQREPEERWFVGRIVGGSGVAEFASRSAVDVIASCVADSGAAAGGVSGGAAAGGGGVGSGAAGPASIVLPPEPRAQGAAAGSAAAGAALSAQSLAPLADAAPAVGGPRWRSSVHPVIPLVAPVAASGVSLGGSLSMFGTAVSAAAGGQGAASAAVPGDGAAQSGAPGASVAAAPLESEPAISAKDDFVTGQVLPPLVRVAPPLLATAEHELMWLHPEDPPALLWCGDMGTVSPTSVEAWRLLRVACEQPLPSSDHLKLVALLGATPDAVYQAGIRPSKLAALMEHNSNLVVEVMLRINGSHVSDYFSELLSMKMSLHSMEVVNTLSSAMPLPSEFVDMYVYNLMQWCHDAREKYQQNRQVRLACVFLQSLVRSDIISARDSLESVQKFSLDFSRVKEALDLFRHVKDKLAPAP